MPFSENINSIQRLLRLLVERKTLDPDQMKAFADFSLYLELFRAYPESLDEDEFYFQVNLFLRSLQRHAA